MELWSDSEHLLTATSATASLTVLDAPIVSSASVMNQKFTVTVTIRTVGKFGAIAGATESYVTTITA